MTACSRPQLHRSPQFLLRCMCQWQYYYIAYQVLAFILNSNCPRSFKNVYFLNELDTKRRGYYVQLVYSFFLQGKPTTQYIISNCMQSLSINCCRPFRSLTKFTSSVLKLIVSTSATRRCTVIVIVIIVIVIVIIVIVIVIVSLHAIGSIITLSIVSDLITIICNWEFFNKHVFIAMRVIVHVILFINTIGVIVIA